MSKQPSLGDLQPSVPIKDVLAEQASNYDCLPCRLMGSAAFTGLGIYTYGSGMKQLRERELEILRSGSRIGIPARKAGVFVTSAILVGLGVYRLRN